MDSANVAGTLLRLEDYRNNATHNNIYIIAGIPFLFAFPAVVEAFE